jgi:hypothetical protein
MTIQFKTDAVYTLNSLRLICTYIEDNTVWLKSDSYPASDTTLLYKYDRKKGKLYVFNTKVQAYDLVEGSLSEYDVMAKYKPEDVTISYGFMGD